MNWNTNKLFWSFAVALLLIGYNNCSPLKRGDLSSSGNSEAYEDHFQQLLSLDTSHPMDEFSMHDFLSLISENQLKSIESVLSQLPSNYKNNFTLVHTTKSLQGASYMAPRAILFGKDAGLVMTFNGEKGTKAYYNLEILHWNNLSEQYELRELQFDPDGIQFPTLTEANPPKCMQCHSAAPKPTGYVKPIMGDYSTWEGFYGSRDDSIFELPSYVTESTSLTPEDVATVRLEQSQFEKFKSEVATVHPRYKHLFSNEENGYGGHYPYKTNNNGDYLKISFDNAPNTRLTDLLITRQIDQLFNRVKSSEVYDHFKYSIGALMACEQDFTPTELSELTTLLNQTSQYTEVLPLEGNLSINEYYPYKALEVLDFFNVVTRDEWDIGFGINREGNLYDGYTPPMPKNEPNRAILSRIFSDVLEPNDFASCIEYISDFGAVQESEIPSDEYLDFARSRWPVYYCLNSCAKLKTQSQIEIENFKTRIQQNPTSLANIRVDLKRDIDSNLNLTEGPAVLQRCVGCHQEKNINLQIAPYIPFDQPEKLRSMKSIILHLVSDSEPEAKDGGLRMPLGQPPLTAEEIMSLSNYINGAR